MTQLGQLGTEQADPRYRHLDEMSVLEILATMNDADLRVPAAIRTSLTGLAEAIEAAEPRFAAGGRLVYLGAGTSGRLGVLDAAECPPTFHTDPQRVVGLIAGGYRALVDSVEGAEDDEAGGAADIVREQIGPADTVVGLAASGRTPYVIGGLQRARDLGALTIAVSCNSPAALSAVAEHAIEIPVGPEVLTGSTRLKAGSAQKQVLNMISTALMVRTGRTYGNLMIEVQASNAKLRQRAVAMVAQIAGTEYDVAEQAFDRANREVKTAVVMLVQHVAAEPARASLAAVGGRLGEAIGVSSSQHPGLR